MNLIEIKLLAILALVAGALFGFHRFVAGEQAKGAAMCEAEHTEENLVAAQEAQRLTIKAQNRQQEINDEKDAQLRRAGDQLAHALGELRNRPARADLSGAPRAACSGATGAELSRSDAAFLAGEAARAESLRINLDACQRREHPDSLTVTPSAAHPE